TVAGVPADTGYRSRKTRSNWASCGSAAGQIGSDVGYDQLAAFLPLRGRSATAAWSNKDETAAFADTNGALAPNTWERGKAPWKNMLMCLPSFAGLLN